MTHDHLRDAGGGAGPGRHGGDAPLVLHLVTDLRRGGTQTILLERVRTPGPFRHEVLVFAPHTGRRGDRDAPPPDLVAGFRDARVPVHSLELYTPGEAARAWLTGGLDRRLSALPLAARPALVHSTLYHTHLLGDRLRRGWRIPHVASKEGLDLWMRPWNRRLEAGALRRAARVAAVSRAAAESAISLGVPETAIRIIPNGIDLHRPGSWRSPGAEAGFAGARLLAVGRGNRAKGWEDLLAAAALLRREGENVHLDLVVSGPPRERDRLAAAVRRLGIESCVRIFPGEVAGPAPAEERADGAAGSAHPGPHKPDPAGLIGPRPVLVVPSREEGFGLILLEGMARGLPIVATRVGGIPEVARDGREALLVPPRDPPALARGIRRVLDDPALAASLVEGGSARVREFTVEAMVRGYHDLYRETLAG